ncbi:MAG: DegV family protein [Firmicutes bacterium]|nr:DegV family protein [Bacillota bacterium]
MGERIAIVCDSTCDLPRVWIEKYGITVVPEHVRFGDQDFRDGVDLDPPAFYAKLRSSDLLPKTSQPSPAEMQRAYEALAPSCDRIFSIHLSSKLSGAVDSARVAAQSVSVPVEVIDSQFASMAMGFIVVEAAEAAKRGDPQDVRNAIELTRARMHVYFLVDTLSYLQRNGRLGRAQAFMGTLLNVKPLLQLKDGEILPFEQVRSRKRGMERQIEQMRTHFSVQAPKRGAIVHADIAEEAEKFAALAHETFPQTEWVVTYLGAVLGANAGPGVLGIVAYRGSDA